VPKQWPPSSARKHSLGQLCKKYLRRADALRRTARDPPCAPTPHLSAQHLYVKMEYGSLSSLSTRAMMHGRSVSSQYCTPSDLS